MIAAGGRGGGSDREEHRHRRNAGEMPHEDEVPTSVMEPVARLTNADDRRAQSVASE